MKCFGCNCSEEELDAMIKLDSKWWCLDCHDDYVSQDTDIEAAEERRRARIAETNEY